MIKLTVVCLLLKTGIISTIDSIDRNSINEECISNKTLLETNLLNNTCCKQNETHWLVKDKKDMFRCKLNKCLEETKFFFQGECIDPYEDAKCGKEATGERLYVDTDGVSYCDCDEGWVRYGEKCYQEFTPAFCAVDNEILKLDSPPSSCEHTCSCKQLNICRRGQRENFSCIKNPCPPSSYPHCHWSTWNETLYTRNETVCHRSEADLKMTACELVVNENDEEKPLACCKPTSRSDCFYNNQQKEEKDEITLLGVIPKYGKACRRGKVWNVRARRCITAQKGKRRGRAKKTEASKVLTEASKVLTEEQVPESAEK